MKNALFTGRHRFHPQEVAMASESFSHNLAVIFRFCAQSMRYPAKEWFTEKYYTGLCLLLEQLRAEQELCAIKEAVRHHNDDNFLEELQTEYTRLFINATPHVIAPPYGSVYQNRSLAGQYTEDVHLFYRTNGYDLRKGSDFADNIVYQLEFLSYITKEGKNKVQQEFLFRFFLPWFGEFSHRVREEAELPFYLVITSLIDFFTKEEEKYGV